MGLDCTYQGLPSDSIIISKAHDDPDFAENVFYSVIAHASALEDRHYFNEFEYNSVKELFKLNPDVINWSYKPYNRMQQALMYCLNPKSFIAANSFAELSNTFEYGFVRGKYAFSENLMTGEMQRVRYSPPEFVKECEKYTENVSYENLSVNFNAETMKNLNIYKISESSKFEHVYDYFIGLKKLYIELARHGNASIFVTEQ